jgi:PKD repeat protein
MQLISGTYNLIAEADNFETSTIANVVAHDFQTTHQDILLTPNCTIFSDIVENGNQGWTIQTPWAITTEASHSPTHSWTDSPGGTYSNNRNITLTSPAFNFNGNTGVTLDFWHKFRTEPGYDLGYVEYSTGSTWIIAATYTGSSPDWQNVRLSLPALDGQSNARIRFRFYSDSYTVADGWHIDDIMLTWHGAGCVSRTVPSAEFGSNSPVQAGQPVVFTNHTTGSAPITYAWDFGDGVGASTETDPTYAYSLMGTYTVTLQATNPYGTDVNHHAVTINPVSLTGVDLTQVTPGPIFSGHLVEFSADLLPDPATKPYTYTIDFGDGITLTSTSSLDPLEFSHTYTSIGFYTIQFSAQNAGMTLPLIDRLDIQVYSKFFLPVTIK